MTPGLMVDFPSNRRHDGYSPSQPNDFRNQELYGVPRSYHRPSDDLGTVPNSRGECGAVGPSSTNPSRQEPRRSSIPQPQNFLDDRPYVPRESRSSACQQFPPHPHDRGISGLPRSIGRPDIQEDSSASRHAQQNIEHSPGQLVADSNRIMSRGPQIHRHNSNSDIPSGRLHLQLPHPHSTRSIDPHRHPGPRRNEPGHLSQALPFTRGSNYYHAPGSAANDPFPNFDNRGLVAPSRFPPIRHESSSPTEMSSDESFVGRATADSSRSSSRGPAINLPYPYSGPSSSSPSPQGFGSHEHYAPPTMIAPTISGPDPGDILRRQLNLPPGAPVNLHSLQDPPNSGDRPVQSLPTLMKVAIYGSPRKRLTLQEIYTALEDRFEYFRNKSNDNAWKSSIRHALSLQKVFRHNPRPITEPGKGKYWHLDYSQGEGNKRPRKRRGGKGSAASMSASKHAEDDDAELDSDDEHSSQSSHHSHGDELPIDPALRGGHHVGAGRVRSSARHPEATSPYPSSPRGVSSHHQRDITMSPNDGDARYRALHSRSSSSSASPSGSPSTVSTGYGRGHFETVVPSGRQSAFEEPAFRPITFGQPSLIPGDTSGIVPFAGSASIPRPFHMSHSDSFPSSTPSYPAGTSAYQGTQYNRSHPVVSSAGRTEPPPTAINPSHIMPSPQGSRTPSSSSGSSQATRDGNRQQHLQYTPSDPKGQGRSY